MKKRAISTLLVVLIAVSFILPAVATEVTVIPTGTGIPAAARNAETSAPAKEENEPKSFIFLNGVPQSLEYELRCGTTYVTVSSFVSMVDPQAVVQESNGVVTVSSTSAGQNFSMTVSTQLPYIVANGRYLYAKGNVSTVNGRVALPIRKLAEVFNIDVDYDGVACVVLLTSVQGRSAYIQSGDSYYNADTLFWLSRIIYVESGDQSLEGMIAVGNVVMNRVKSPEFPNTLYDVLNQKNQFVSTSIVSQKTPNSNSVVAAKLVIEGVQIVPTALFFNMAGLSSYASKNRPYVTTIGDHAFYA